MTAIKKLGIWMDHSSAHIMEFTNDLIELDTIKSKFTHQAKEDSLSKSESLMHNKEQHQQLEYYKKLGQVIDGYDEVVLFGPTDAKVELYNLLKEDRHFEKIKIEIRNTDKMTHSQEFVFVRAFFSKN